MLNRKRFGKSLTPLAEEHHWNNFTRLLCNINNMLSHNIRPRVLKAVENMARNRTEQKLR